MRHPRNRPRSRHKLAAWEAEQQRRERCDLSTGLIVPAIASRSLSLRAASFKEAQPQRSEFKRGSVKRPKQKRDDRARNATVRIAQLHGFADILEIALRD